MSAAPWYVWSGLRAGGCFPNAAAAASYVKRLANDHRAKKEFIVLSPECWRYVGPRGRRHGTRLVAYLGTRVALEELGLNVAALVTAIEKAS
jgi:hypothetical protein